MRRALAPRGYASSSFQHRLLGILEHRVRRHKAADINTFNEANVCGERGTGEEESCTGVTGTPSNEFANLPTRGLDSLSQGSKKDFFLE